MRPGFQLNHPRSLAQAEPSWSWLRSGSARINQPTSSQSATQRTLSLSPSQLTTKRWTRPTSQQVRPALTPAVASCLRAELPLLPPGAASTSKRSKWDDDPSEADLIAQQQEQQAKRQKKLQARLLKERNLARAAASAATSAQGSSREGTPDARALAGRGLVPGAGVGVKGGARDVRSLHPGLESCRSVYEYEVSREG